MEDNQKTKKGKKEKDKKKDKKKDPKGKEKKEKEEGFLWSMPRSISLPLMVRAWEDYARYWNAKLETDNVEQRMDIQVWV